ncbi:MAG: putative glycoside hydrolase [Aquabacterium sp.]|uniref:putative glycoside hydrolase n=1 Tax=Aquabacterium sp. TaxID=1872578 RepID=UPI002717E0BC|nr:putative glycoside hydrolase [Aquabacterium sp.]MDO9005813.1 putative glycoside hydrolase [Aquabacterium sp.]
MKALFRLLAVLGLWMWSLPALTVEIVVIDQSTGKPLKKAVLVANEILIPATPGGTFSVADIQPLRVSARAHGYQRTQVDVQLGVDEVLISLAPIRPKAIYLSTYGIGSQALREEALKLIDRTELNALVIDVKGDRGQTLFHTQAANANETARKTLGRGTDTRSLIQALKSKGIYLIGRVVVFKDDPLSELHPEWSVKDSSGKRWRDKEGLGWIDPFQTAAWSHSLGSAEEAADMGFDEIQFDYLRFPDARGLKFSQSNTAAARVNAINAFLDQARQRLQHRNVFISADVFGYVLWNTNDTDIGQQLETIIERVDYLSPMLYPSGFTWGIPGHPDAAAAPFDVVNHSLRRALERTGVDGVRLRPWLQAFRDYAFDKRAFGATQIRQQIQAAESLGTDGWMLWNARNRYSSDGLSAP